MTKMNMCTRFLLAAICFNVVGAQNAAPYFTNNLYDELVQTGIDEGTPVGTIIGKLKAVDPENGNIRYSGSMSNTLKVWPDGDVELTRLLDKENLPEEDNLIIIFKATDEAQNEATVELVISVSDVNDNIPNFEKTPYSAQISEKAEVGTTVLIVTVTDKDSSDFARLEFDCLPLDSYENTCDKFEIQATQVDEHTFRANILLKDPIDYEIQNVYTMAIRARDNPGSTPQLERKVNIAIGVIDEQDTLPSFFGGILTINVMEHSPIGDTSRLWTLNARDGDQGNPRTIRMYATDPLGLFRIGPSFKSPINDGEYRAQVYINGDIDREALQALYQFNVTAVEVVNGEDTEDKVNSYVIVSILDINDNIPQFSKSFYTVDVQEMDSNDVSTQINGLSIFVEDKDDPSNGRFDISISNQQGHIFTVFPRNATGVSFVAIQVIQPQLLDYEKPANRKLYLTLRASESDNSSRFSTAEVEINLTDANDNAPEFTQALYTAEIREDSAIGTLVTNLIDANDRDSGDFGRIKYSLQGTDSDIFNIDEDTGVVTLAAPVDYEAMTFYDIRVVARDMASPPIESQVALKINISNFNDAGPVFNPATYRTQIRESSREITIPVKVQATDEDSLTSMSYSIVAGNTQDRAFVIDQYTGVLSLNRRVSYQETPNEYGQFVLTIQATDSDFPPRSTNTTVTIGVIDENNNYPAFDQTTYTKTISEVTMPGQTVITVSATDKDSGTNGEIEYYIESGSKDHFVVNPDSGDIYISDRAKLDADEYNRYEVIVHGRDKGSPSLTGSATVNIYLTDANNKAPFFETEIYMGNVQEKVAADVFILNVKANDPDTGSSLEYGIVQDSFLIRDKDGNVVIPLLSKFNPADAFKIDKTSGDVSTAMSLERDKAAEISFDVSVTDINAETTQQTGIATVIITILGSVDMAVRFISQKSVTLPEEMAINSKILSVVAFDYSTLTNIHDYRKIESTDPLGRFKVDQYTGSVNLTKVLDYDSPNNDRKVTFQVEAFSDDGTRSAQQTLTVLVTDINDNKPIFYESIYRFSVQENHRYPYEVGYVIASDIDSGSYADIAFSLYGYGSEKFRIFDSGMIIIREGVELDYEDTDLYTLRVIAKDNPKGILSEVSKEGSILMEISVTDVNDNCPQFESADPVSLYTVETSPKASTIGLIVASDKDGGSNGQVQFSIVNATHEGALFFGIQLNTGVFYTQTLLQGASHNSPYRLTVRASDLGVPVCHTDTQVSIFVSSGQQSDGRPIWNYPDMGEVVYIMEHSPIDTYVARALVYPQTKGSHIIYSFLRGDEYRTKFSIDSLSGNITVSGDLDREDKEVYAVIILAVDALNTTRQNTRLLTIRLLDKDDKLPSFMDCPHIEYDVPERVKLNEEQDVGVFVFQAVACDLDKELQFNSILYSPYQQSLNDELCDSEAWEKFSLDAVSGEIRTKVRIDREDKSWYLLCVQAKSANGRRKRGISNEEIDTLQTEISERGIMENVLYLLVEIIDKNDNGPALGSPPTAVIYKLPLEETVVLIQAKDPDASPFNRVHYSIEESIFTVLNGQNISFMSAFLIDEDSGLITINYPSYADFGEGYFTITVRAEDYYDPSMFDLQDIKIYVADRLNRVKITMNSGPEEATAELKLAMKKLGYEYKTSGVTFHKRTGGSFDTSKTDICMVILSEGKILSVESSVRKLEDSSDVLATHKISDPQACDPDSSQGIEGWDVFWWVLVAFAIFIFFVCLVLVILICILHRNYRSYMDTRQTYLVPQ